MLVAIGFAILFVIVFPLAIALTVLWLGLLHTRGKVQRTAAAARSSIDRGESVNEVTELLLHADRLPSLAAVRALADATGMRAADALQVVLPHLGRRQRDFLNGMSSKRFEALLHRFYP